MSVLINEYSYAVVEPYCMTCLKSIAKLVSYYYGVAVYHTGHMAKTQYEPPPLFTASTPR